MTEMQAQRQTITAAHWEWLKRRHPKAAEFLRRLGVTQIVIEKGQSRSRIWFPGTDVREDWQNPDRTTPFWMRTPHSVRSLAGFHQQVDIVECAFVFVRLPKVFLPPKPKAKK